MNVPTLHAIHQLFGTSTQISAFSTHQRGEAVCGRRGRRATSRARNEENGLPAVPEKRVFDRPCFDNSTKLGPMSSHELFGQFDRHNSVEQIGLCENVP